MNWALTFKSASIAVLVAAGLQNSCSMPENQQTHKTVPKSVFCSASDAKVIQDFNLKRAYPELAQRRGIEGAVTVNYSVGANGRVAGFYVRNADHPRYFENSTEREFKRMRWTPAKNERCQAVPSPMMTRRIVYQLPGCEPAIICQ